jgi:SAM-dependent methyltransferase
MNESLKNESDRLACSWMKHDAAWLRDYLVAGVEDPRLNLQSIFSRHFLVRELVGDQLGALMSHEYRFASVMNWLITLRSRAGDPGEFCSVLYALQRGADNAEGIDIPQFVLQTFRALPAVVCGLTIDNYVEAFLQGCPFAGAKATPHQPGVDTFARAWNVALSRITHHTAPSLLEPACGSANDYRFLHSFGLAPLLNYTGFDLCAKNVENARALFPGARFEIGNVFEIAAPDKAFDLCVIHDLFEHLSIEGLNTAVKEICRVTRSGLCVGFFQMDEIPEHVVRPVDEYHWNLLSMARMKELFGRHRFAAQAVHIGTFLRRQIGSELTHNPNAYTFFLHPA